MAAVAKVNVYAQVHMDCTDAIISDTGGPVIAKQALCTAFYIYLYWRVLYVLCLYIYIYARSMYFI